MKKKVNPAVVIGAFLACLCVVSIAARYEDFVVGKLTVENTATFESTIVATGALTASTLGISEGLFDVVNTTQLVFIASGVTNVIDADITN